MNPALPAMRNVFRKERVFVFWSYALAGRMIFETRPPRHRNTPELPGVFFVIDECQINSRVQELAPVLPPASWLTPKL